MEKIKLYLSWAKTMLRTSAEKRAEWVENILAGFRSYRKGKAGDKYLSDVLSSDEYELLGFAVNSCYIKDKLGAGDASDDLGVMFVHPFGSPALLYKHRNLPVLVIAGPGVRLNQLLESHDGSIDGIGVRGITG